MAVSKLTGPGDRFEPGDASVYVGPRPYRLGQQLYGRDREAVELSRLLISQRLVLLHSPSGAGKTSLIHAKIVPAMQKRRFEIPIDETSDAAQPQPIAIRVNREPLDSDPRGVNRYKLSAMLSLELQRPEPQRRGAEELAGMSLDDYLEDAFPAASRDIVGSEPEAEGFRPLLLLFDQFEELVTMDPTDESVKKEFVQDLGTALSNRGRWALFAIREDFLGALEPYLPAIPTGLSATFRLDLLRAESAAAVIAEPARNANVTYEAGVVDDIVEDLRRIRVQAADGSFQYKAGIYVEPVQLQVVCQSLWRIREDSAVITHAHLEKLGRGRRTGVDAVLAGYYANRVAQAACESDVSERLVRNWFSKSLIGTQRVRRPVLVDEALFYGLTLDCLEVLDKAFLIRRENRSGTIWYELAHDRLMDPVLEDNELWSQAHLTTFQAQAEIWEDRGRPDSVLFTDEFLESLEADDQEAEQLTAYEQDFLQASRKARAQQMAEQAREQELSRVKRNRRIMVAGTVLFAIVGTLCAVALSQWSQKRIIERQREEAQWLAYAGQISLAQQHLELENPILARVVLDDTDPEMQGWEYEYLDARIKERQNTFVGHKTSVISLDIVKNGTQLATADRDGIVILRALSIRKPLNDVSISMEHEDRVNCMAITPDGRQIVTGGDDHTLRIWDVRHEQPRILGRHTTAVTHLIIDPQGQWVASAAQDSSLILWDLDRKLPENKIKSAHDGAILCMDVSSDGELIITGDSDGTIKIWDTDKTRDDDDNPIETMRSKEGRVTCIGISPDKKWLVSGSDSHSLYFWFRQPDGDLKPRPRTIGNHKSAVSSLAINHDGTKVVTGTVDGVLKEWDVGPIVNMLARDKDSRIDFLKTLNLTLDPVMDFQAHNGIITSLKYVLRHHRIVSSSDDNSTKIWDGAPASEDPAITGHTGPVWDFDYSPDGQWIVTASGDQTLRIVQLEDGTTRRTLEGHDDAVYCATVSPDGERVVSGSADKTIRVWNAKTGIELFKLEGHDDAVSRIIFSPTLQGQQIISSCFDGTVKLWDLKSPEKAIWTFKGHQGGVTDLAISPDGKHLVSSGLDKTVRILERSTGELVRTLAGHDDIVWSVAISPDGKRISSGSVDRKIRIWDFSSGDLLKELKGHTAGILRLDYGPDGLRLASGSIDNTVKLWELNSGKDVLTLWDHDDSVWGVKFSPDGKRIVSCSEDWTLKVWDTARETNVGN
jgi:WD40 repeat protein